MRTALYEAHTELGAKIVDFAGWDMPIQYKNLKNEVLQVRDNVGVFDVSHMGEFFISGTDTIRFLDELVTNDVKNAELLKAIYSPLCREDGTIIDDLIVYKLTQTEVMICVNAANIEKDLSWISSKAHGYNVKIEDKSKLYSLIAVQGPKTFEVLSTIELGSKLEDIPYYSIQTTDLSQDVPVLFARTGYTGEDGFEIFGSHEYIKNIWNQLINKGVEPCGLGARDVLRLEVCYPLYGHELNDEVTPLDSGLRWTVKLNKDHFFGKEALVAYEPKSRLIKFTIDKGVPRAGYKIVNSKKESIGFVTSGTMSPCLGLGIAIARIDKDQYNPKETYSIEIRNKIVPINIVKKSFVTGGHK